MLYLFICMMISVQFIFPGSGHQRQPATLDSTLDLCTRYPLRLLESPRQHGMYLVSWEACPTHLHMDSSRKRVPDLLILSLMPLGHMLLCLLFMIGWKYASDTQWLETLVNQCIRNQHYARRISPRVYHCRPTRPIPFKILSNIGNNLGSIPNTFAWISV